MRPISFYQFAAEPRDTTPPIISYDLSTPPNGAGWHNSPVTLTWTVSDPESSPSTQTGCDPTTVNTDGTFTFTCSATSEGGTASQSVTIDYDVTAAVVNHVLSTPANTNGWHNADVTIDWLATDIGGSGVTADPADTVATTEGANVAYTSPEACDLAANCATGSAQLSIDKATPNQSNFTPAGPLLIVVGSRNFTIDATDVPSGVDLVEYYFDTDPGPGNGTAAALATGSTYRGVLDTGTSNFLTPHTLFVRTRDEAGNWSTTFSRTFFEIL